MKSFFAFILFAVLLGILVGYGIQALSHHTQSRKCDQWRAATGEQVRMTSHGCYVREDNQFVPLAQRKLDASIQAAQ